MGLWLFLLFEFQTFDENEKNNKGKFWPTETQRNPYLVFMLLFYFLLVFL